MSEIGSSCRAPVVFDVGYACEVACGGAANWPLGC
jgi:hypothetical protein